MVLHITVGTKRAAFIISASNSESHNLFITSASRYSLCFISRTRSRFELWKPVELPSYNGGVGNIIWKILFKDYNRRMVISRNVVTIKRLKIDGVWAAWETVPWSRKKARKKLWIISITCARFQCQYWVVEEELHPHKHRNGANFTEDKSKVQQKKIVQ